MTYDFTSIMDRHGKDAIAGVLPVDDGIVVLVSGIEIAESRVLGTLDDGLGYGRHRREVHIGHPHGNDIEALLGRVGGESRLGTQAVNRNGVLAVPIHDAGEIVRH